MKRSRVILFCAAMVAAPGAARADEAADRRVVESKAVAVKSLLSVVRSQPGTEDAARQAEAALARAEDQAKAQRWGDARRSLEEAQALLVAATPRPQAGPAAASPEQVAAAIAEADRRVVESKAVAVRSLLGVVRAQAGAEEVARRAEALIARSDDLARTRAWKQARGALEEAELILVAAVPRPQAAPAAADPARVSAEARAASDHRVYEAKKVAVGSLLAVVRGQPERQAAVARAEALIAEADARASAREWPAARASLEQAQGVLMAAVPVPAPAAKDGAAGNAPSEAAERLYAARRESVSALRDALQRIGAESAQSSASARAALESARGQLEVSAGLARQGKLAEAKDLLDQAYLLLKVNIEGLRRGQTVVHEKKFASAEDEYAYERERSDSYILLVRMFMGWDGQGTAPKHGDRVAGGLSVRRDAETLAAAGKHADAVRSMEQSTLILTQVLRLLGLPIP